MPVPTAKLLRLLSAEHPPEVRRATALVLGELGVRDGEAAQALCDALQDADSSVRVEVIRAVGKLRVEPALPQLLARIKEGGAEAGAAALAAAHLGPKGTRALQELMPKVAPGLRRTIAAALAGGGTASATAAAAAVLLDKDPGVVEAAVRSLAEQIPTLATTQRHAWTDQLLELAGDRQGGATPPLPTTTQAAVVRLLAALDDPRAGAALWDKLAPPHPAEVRAAALQGLGKWASAPTKDQLKRLFICAADADFRIAAPALVILQRLPVHDRILAEWRTLLRAPDVAVRRLALDKLGGQDDAETAAALVEQLHHRDRGLRDAALARLTQMDHGRQALTAALLEAESPDQAWPLARAVAPFARDFPAAWRDEVFDRAGKHLEGGDRRADPLLFLLKETGAADLRDRLERRALAHRKKKAYATALLYLRLLARDPACGFATRLELAACGLIVSGKDLATESRAGDPCLGQFALLCQQDEAELVRQVEQIKWLAAEDLYYLGFHLVEQEGRAKKAGGAVLKLAAKRSPRTKVGQAAKRKLASAGLS